MVVTIKDYQVEIDEKDLPLIQMRRWSPSHHEGRGVYFFARIGGQHAALHRTIVSAPRGMQVDHIDGNTMNNRRKSPPVLE